MRTSTSPPACEHSRSRRLLRLTLIISLLIPLPAMAQSHFEVQFFHQLPSQNNSYYNIGMAKILDHWQWELGLMANYANDPLVLVDESDNRVYSLVGSQLTLNLLGAVAPTTWLEVGVDLPLVLSQSGDAITEIPDLDADAAGFSLGDLRLVAQAMFYSTESDDHPWGLSMGLLTSLFLPTGNSDFYQGEGVRFEPRFLIDYAFKRGTRVSANLGYLIRPEAQVANLTVNDALTFGVASDIPLISIVSLVPEIAGQWSLLAEENRTEELPIEGLLGLKIRPIAGLLLSVGAGMGLNNGYGAPDWRVFLGVSYSATIEQDRDEDGYLDDEDGCPNDPEDFDDFEDDDGCSDPDNDDDTLSDVVDACPDDPEDFDSWRDADGCPDPDNDDDGLADLSDACPLAPEDFDNFEDNDGCPDPDNDDDRIFDTEDDCPNEAETINGFEDEDGCPDASPLVELTCERIALRDRVYFDTDSDVIQERSYELLNQVAGILLSRNDIRSVRIEGHTDDRGSSRHNTGLSQRRAESVRDYLVDRGIETERLVPVGFGEDVPIADNSTREGRAENRRVDFIIIEQDGCQ